MTDSVKLIQLNCHNAYQSHTKLKLLMSKNKSVITLVQEPYVNNKKTLANYPSGYDIFPTQKTQHPRTAIFASRHLKLTEINELCNSDMTTVGGIIEGSRIMLASIYMHYDKPVISKNLEGLIQYSRSHSFQLIIAADTNSHSNLWGPDPCLLYTSPSPRD